MEKWPVGLVTRSCARAFPQGGPCPWAQTYFIVPTLPQRTLKVLMLKGGDWGKSVSLAVHQVFPSKTGFFFLFSCVCMVWTGRSHSCWCYCQVCAEAWTTVAFARLCKWQHRENGKWWVGITMKMVLTCGPLRGSWGPPAAYRPHWEVQL